MPIARPAAHDAGQTDDDVEPAEPRLSVCEDAWCDELVWKEPDAELDHVLVPLDGEK